MQNKLGIYGKREKTLDLLLRSISGDCEVDADKDVPAMFFGGSSVREVFPTSGFMPATTWCGKVQFQRQNVTNQWGISPNHQL